jgi:hypothetical protein
MTSVGRFYGSSSEKQIGMVLVLVPHINSTRNLVLDLVFLDPIPVLFLLSVSVQI